MSTRHKLGKRWDSSYIGPSMTTQRSNLEEQKGLLPPNGL